MTSLAALFVQGGPTARERAELDAHGIAVVTVEAATPAELAAAVAGSRAERTALWFTGRAAMLSAGWLRDPPEWLRCVAMTAPILEPHDDVRYRPAEAVEVVGDAAAAGVAGAQRAGALPIVLVEADLERPDIAAFVAAAERAEANLIEGGVDRVVAYLL